MHIRVHANLDPALEVILLLERAYASGGSVPSSMPAAFQALSEKFSIPMEQMERLARSILPMEEELLALLRPKEALWRSMFYADSRKENLLAWGFFFLERQQPLEQFDLSLRRRLTALMLNCDAENLDSVRDLDTLMYFLEPFPCGSQAKWICAQVWQQPEQFYRQYRELVRLATPVVEKYDLLLQPLIQTAVNQAAQALKNDPNAFWRSLGISAAPQDSLVIYPMVNNFNGIGITWDHTVSEGTAYLTIGLLRNSLSEMIHRYSDNSEFLADRLKALSDQRRIEILKALKTTPMYGQELADLVSLSPATISHHMSSLVSAGFVSVNRQGARTSYTLHRENLNSFLQNLHMTLL